MRGLIHGHLELPERERGWQGEGVHHTHGADLVQPAMAVPPDVPHVLHVRRVPDHHLLLLLFVVVIVHHEHLRQALDPLHEPLHSGRHDPRRRWRRGLLLRRGLSAATFL